MGRIDDTRVSCCRRLSWGGGVRRGTVVNPVTHRRIADSSLLVALHLSLQSFQNFGRVVEVGKVVLVVCKPDDC